MAKRKRQSSRLPIKEKPIFVPKELRSKYPDARKYKKATVITKPKKSDKIKKK